MKLKNFKKLNQKELVVFDLDGTLALTKSTMDKEMVGLMQKLLESRKVAVIGGGKYQLFQFQLLEPLAKYKVPKELLKNLYLFPATSTSFFKYHNGWKKVYAHQLSAAVRAKIKKTFQEVFKAIGYEHPAKTYGPVIEDRGTQVTFSALGQEVVAVLGRKRGVALKDKWRDEHTPTKMKIAKEMAKRLPELEVRAAGHTSVDITRKGIDKAYGLREIEKRLKINLKNSLFVGDAIFPGGNDYAVVKTPIDYIPVKGPEETKEIIRQVIAK